MIFRDNYREISQKFEVLKEIRQECRRFNTIGTQLTVRLNLPNYPDTNPMGHFIASVNDLFKHALQDVGEADIVGIAIHNEVNQNDRPIGISFRRRDQLSGDMIWSVFEVSQSNSRFNALAKMIVVLHSVRMPVSFGGIENKSRQLSIIAHLKKSIIEVKAETVWPTT